MRRLLGLIVLAAWQFHEKFKLSRAQQTLDDELMLISEKLRTENQINCLWVPFNPPDLDNFTES